MPKRAPRVCGCSRVVPAGEPCPSCSTQRNRAAEARRPSARERGYDSRWDRARRGYLAKHPTCARCGKPAAVVDHVRPHRGDKALFWDATNWQSLCSPCHNGAKQSDEKRGGSSRP